MGAKGKMDDAYQEWYFSYTGQEDQSTFPMKCWYILTSKFVNLCHQELEYHAIVTFDKMIKIMTAYFDLCYGVPVQLCAICSDIIVFNFDKVKKSLVKTSL